MMTMRPSPRIVAPAMPRMPEICGPSDLTTISRLPTSSSVTSAVECSPARISTTDIDTSASGSASAEADERAQLLEAVFLAAVFEQRRVLAEVPRDDVARQAHHALDGRQRQRVDLLATRTISAWLMASVNGRRIVKREPLPASIR
jgi:hypothetical protein